MNKKNVLTLLTAAVCVCCVGCSTEAGKNEIQNTTKQIADSTNQTEDNTPDGVREEPVSVTEVQRDGITYIEKKYTQFEVTYPVLNAKVVSEEKIKDFTLQGGLYGLSKDVYVDKDIKIVYMTYGNNILLPNLFQAENISKVKYTLFNFPGILGTSEMAYSKNQITRMEGNSVEISNESLQNLYLSFCNPYKGEKNIDNIYKDDLDQAIIKAEISYKDGSAETLYLGVRQRYPNTPYYLDIYQLTLE